MLEPMPPDPIPSAGRPNGAAHTHTQQPEAQHAQEARGAPRVPGRLRDLQETADLLHLSQHTVRKLVREGKIRPVRICRRLLFSVDEIARVIAESK
jgi:excisionase family DNA binding protein